MGQYRSNNHAQVLQPYQTHQQQRQYQTPSKYVPPTPKEQSYIRVEQQYYPKNQYKQQQQQYIKKEVVAQKRYSQKREQYKKHNTKRQQIRYKEKENKNQTIFPTFKNGKIKINLLSAVAMEDKDVGINHMGFVKEDKSDIFCTFEVPNSKHLKSTIVKDSTNPTWNREEFIFKISDPLNDILTITVQDYDAMINDKIGTVQIDIIDIVNAPQSKIKKGEFEVVGSKYGLLCLDLMYFEQNDDYEQYQAQKQNYDSTQNKGYRQQGSY